jgi:hypothetical protein
MGLFVLIEQTGLFFQSRLVSALSASLRETFAGKALRREDNRKE